MNNVDEAGKSDNKKVNRFIEVPRGWSRGLEKESVFYISPSSECLRSKEDVARYLTSDNTCKCGLECPIYLDKTFNFDASIPSRHYKVGQLEKAGHQVMCSLSMAAVNVFKNKPWMQADEGISLIPKHKNSTNSYSVTSLFPIADNNVSKLPSFETFKNTIPGESNSEGQTTKVKKPNQSKSSTKRKPANRIQSVSIVNKGNKECTTIHSTNAPIPHSHVKNTMPTKRLKESSPVKYTPKIATTIVTRTEEQHLHGLNNVSVLSFPSSHMNASSYLASLSSSVAPGNRFTLPVNHSAAVQPITTSRSFATTTVVDTSLGRKPVSSVFSPSASGAHIIAHPKPGSLPESATHLNVTPLPTGRNNLEKLAVGNSKAAFSMSAVGNVRNVPPVSSSTNQYFPPYMVPTTSSTNSYPKTVLNQTDRLLSTKAAVSAHVQQSPRMNSTLLSVKREQQPATSTHPTTMVNQNEKSKPKTIPTCESQNPAVQYCGILLQPTVPQLQASTSNPSNTAQGVDTSHLTGFNVLPGLPFSNNVAPLASSTVLGMSPGTFVPYVLGIAPNMATSRPTATMASTSSSSAATTTPSTGSAAIAAAYSAFVSIAPASGTSSSYSQHLMNLVSNYSPYWQQLLSHPAGSNALAYQLMQMNQYAALRGATAQAAAKTPKNSGQKQQTSSTTSSSSFERSGSHATPPVALVVVGPKDLSSCTSSKTTTSTRLQPIAKALAKPSSSSVESPVEKAPDPEKVPGKQQISARSGPENTTVSSTSGNVKVSTVPLTHRESSHLKPGDNTQFVKKKNDDNLLSEQNSIDTNKKLKEPEQKSTDDKKLTGCGQQSSKYDQKSLKPENEISEHDQLFTEGDHQLLENNQQSSNEDDQHSVEHDQSSLEPDQQLLQDDQRSIEHDKSLKQRYSEHEHRLLGHDQHSLKNDQQSLKHAQHSAEHDHVNSDQILQRPDETFKDCESKETTQLLPQYPEHDTPKTDDVKGEMSHDIVNTVSPPDSIHETTNTTAISNTSDATLSTSLDNQDRNTTSLIYESENTVNQKTNIASISKDLKCEEMSVETCHVTDEGVDLCKEKQTVPVTSSGSDVVKGNDAIIESSRDSVQSGETKEPVCNVNNLVQTKETLVHNVNNLVQNGEIQSTSNADMSNNENIAGEEAYDPMQFTIGDVVWAQARGLPSWPGKIVDEKDVGSEQADNGKRWVMWFGDHTFSQVEVEKLKTLTDGLKTLDDNKGKKRKYRGKKTRIGLEQAIGEALEELEERQNARSRQGSKAKKRRLRF